MKNLIFLLILLSLFSCKKDEPHSDPTCVANTNKVRTTMTNPVNTLDLADSITFFMYYVEDTSNLQGQKLNLIQSLRSSKNIKFAFTRKEYFVFDEYTNIVVESGTYTILNCGNSILLTNISDGKRYMLESSIFDTGSGTVTVRSSSNNQTVSIDIHIKIMRDLIESSIIIM